MNKLLIAMIGTGLVFSSNAFSLTPDCAHCGYTAGLSAPRFTGGFYAGVTGAWLRVSESGIGLNDYILGVADDSGQIVNSKLARFDQDHEWQWALLAGYDIPCSSYNLEVNYLHIDDSDHRHHQFDENFASVDSFFVTNLGFSVSPSAAFPITLVDFNTGSELSLKFDQFDVKLGRQYNDVCGLFQIKPSFGVRYATLDHNYRSRFNTELLDDVEDVDSEFVRAQFNIHSHSEFNGIGPMASFDARYGFCGGFGIVGHFDVALLVGEIDSHLNNRTDLTFLEDDFDGPVLSTGTSEARWHVPSTDRVVTNLNGKFGIDYAYCFCNKTSLTIEVGYEASKYYDAVDLIRGELEISPLLIPTGNTTRQAVTATDSNTFEFRGPYVSATFHL